MCACCFSCARKIAYSWTYISSLRTENNTDRAEVSSDTGHRCRSGDDMFGDFGTSAENSETLRHQDRSAPVENSCDSLFVIAK